MDAKELPARPNLEHYRKLANALRKAYESGDAASLKRIQDHYQQPLTANNIRELAQRGLNQWKNSKKAGGKLTLTEAQFLIARSHAFESWPKFKKHIEAVLRKSSPVSKFEATADAIIHGDIAGLKKFLRENPELIRARSTRVHQSTLLHYVAANGVEDFRQKTPKNIVEVTKILLKAGAEVDAENNPGGGTALGLVATSVHPARAGVQIALLETLLEACASPNGLQGGWNPLTAALANGRGEAAEYLAMRGARLDLEGAAGVGQLDAVKSFFHADGDLRANATRAQMEDGFMWACQYGRTSVVAFLLEKGFDVSTKRRCTGLHWAAYGGHADITKLLLARKARLDIEDESFGGTPLDWALHGWGDRPTDAHYEAVALLVAAGATVDPKLFLEENVRADRRMLAALRGEN